MTENTTHVDHGYLQWLVVLVINFLFGGGVLMKLIPWASRVGSDVERHNKEIPILQSQHSETLKLLHDIHTSVQVIKATMPKRKSDEADTNEH